MLLLDYSPQKVSIDKSKQLFVQRRYVYERNNVFIFPHYQVTHDNSAIYRSSNYDKNPIWFDNDMSYSENHSTECDKGFK